MRERIRRFESSSLRQYIKGFQPFAETLFCFIFQPLFSYIPQTYPKKRAGGLVLRRFFQPSLVGEPFGFELGEPPVVFLAFFGRAAPVSVRFSRARIEYFIIFKRLI